MAHRVSASADTVSSFSSYSTVMNSFYSRATSIFISQVTYLKRVSVCQRVSQLSADGLVSQGNWESRKLIYLSDVTRDIVPPERKQKDK